MEASIPSHSHADPEMCLLSFSSCQEARSDHDWDQKVALCFLEDEEPAHEEKSFLNSLASFSVGFINCVQDAAARSLS